MNSEHQSASSTTKNITLGFLLSWAIGILLLLSGTGLLMSSIVTGALVILGALIMLPPVNEYLGKQSGVHISGGVRFIIAVILLGVGVAFVSSDGVSGSSSVASESSSGEQVKAMELVDISTRVTESNSVWSKFAWNLTLKNNTDRDRAVTAEIKWVDKDGFVVDTDYEYSLVVPANSEKTFNDYQLIDASVASNVEGIEAEVK